MTESNLYCDNCGRPIGPPPPDAPHKRFCSAPCRNQWHGRRRQMLMKQALNVPELVNHLQAVGLNPVVIDIDDET